MLAFHGRDIVIDLAPLSGGVSKVSKYSSVVNYVKLMYGELGTISSLWDMDGCHSL